MLEIAVCRLQCKHRVCICKREFEVHRGVNNMGKRITDYPHTISFRLTDEAWLGIQKQIAGSDLTAHEWCRKAALDRLNNNYGLSKIERLLLEHFVRAQYLVTQGFQLLADDKLTGDNWKKLRVIATERASEITDNALALRAQRSRERS
jgi:hypothetical protein